MTRSGPRRTAWGAGLLTLALAGGVAPAASAAPAATAVPTAAGDPVTVVSTDFEDGSWAPWEQSGSPTLSVVEVDGDKALLVSNRVNDYDGIQTPAGLLQPGVQYTFSMQARLAEGTPGPADVRFVVRPDFTWVGNTAVTADAWTTVTGTLTVPEGATGVAAYLGTGNLAAPAPYGYLVDDLVITSTDPGEPTPDPDVVPGGAVDPTTTPLAAARGTGNVAALTFDDGPNPGETDTLLDFLAEKDLTATFCVIGQNITAPGGAELLRRIVAEGHTLCNHTTSYADMGSWTPEQVRADLVANLQIIRDTLGDPDFPVPYFRAPNGSWGQTGPVAASLGMQPLGLGNIIFDWDGNDLSEPTLTQKLRDAFTPGAVVLVHDGGGNRENGMRAVRTVVTEKLAEGWMFTLPQGGVPDGVPGGTTVLTSDFEDGLDGWVPRGDEQGDPTVAVTTTESHGGAQAALVSDRTSQGDGLLHDLTGLLQPGTTYEIEAWVKFAAGTPAEQTGPIWLSARRDNAGTPSFDTVAQVAGVSATEWTRVAATYTMGAAETASLYFETAWPDGTAAPFLVDDVVVRVPGSGGAEDLTPLKDTVTFPVGVAIDERETTGAAGDLVVRHFDQITGENHMKPEAWYDAERTFGTHPQATALMRFAQENDLRVYGHTLVWHSQTPAWFFQTEAGTPLTSSEADKQVLRDRLRAHVFAVAEALSTGGGYGEFGSDTNPLVAFDVVNEVVSDGTTDPGGLRQSEWYRILGEDFIDLAFRYADDAFNGEFAVDGDSRPVALTINDYNTEQSGKQERLHALVERLLARGVPVDNVGHQFHVSLSMPVQALEDAIVAFQDLPVQQVVSELDVTTGTPVTEAKLIEQGYYYRDAFDVFREHAADMYSVTVWGLTDGRSWRADAGAPLLFTDALTGKPAFLGAAGLELPAVQQSALVFRGDVPVAPGATAAVEWSQLPLAAVGENAGFALRWEADHLTAYVRVTDATVDPTDAIAFTLGDRTVTVGRDGQADVPVVVEPVEGGWAAVVRLPLATAAAEGDQLRLDVRVTDGATTTGWNSPGTTGTLTLIEPLSSTEVVEAAQAPTIDGVVDAAWADANQVTTDTQVEGTGGATATVRTLWRENTLYVLAEVTDPVLDTTASDPWQQDSVEIFLDAGNARAGGYRDVDTQIRIDVENETSFGTGDQAAQQARLTSATATVAGGYVVEAAIDLLGTGGVGTFHGLDFQVNDASNGARTSVRTWADPTGQGYQSTVRWGVGQLVAADPEPGPDPVDPVLDPAMVVERVVRAGDDLDVELTGFAPGSTVHLSLESERGTRPATTTHLGEVTIGADGSATATESLGRELKGVYSLVAQSGDVELEERIVVRKPKAGTEG